MTLVIAHRGASAYAAENTMPAFELAVQQNADMIEMDVRRSADGVLVLFHDDTTERWDGRKRRVADCSFTELQMLNINGAQVTTLAEACAFAREKGMRLNIEIKVVGIGAQVIQTLRNEHIEELVIISSFKPAALREIAGINPKLPRGYLMGHETYRPDIRFREAWPFPALRRSNSTAWHPAYQLPFLTWLIPRVRQAGYRVNVWTVDDVAVMRRLLALGVDGIITDTPDVLRSLLEETGAIRKT